MRQIIQVVQHADRTVTDVMDMVYPTVRADQMLAAELGDLLCKHYPGHLWYVRVDSRPTVGIVSIYNGIISRSHSYNLHIDTVYNDPDRKCIIRAAGELLERANVKRGTWEWDADMPEYVEGLPKKYQPGKGFVR